MVANHLLTFLCNLLSNLSLTDMWTGYKAFRTEVIGKIPIQSKGFNFEPEITIKLAKLGCHIYEVPVRYVGRSYAEGKKIRPHDAFIGLWTMLTTWLFGSLSDASSVEQDLRILSAASRYSRLLRDELYGPHLGPRVIEVGSGVGNVSSFLLDRDRVVLSDSDPRYVRQLQRLYKDWEYVEVQPLDILRPEGLDGLWGKFDSAVCFNVLEHVEDDRAALANLRRLVVPGGNVLLIVPAHPWLYGALDESVGHFRRYERHELQAKLQEAGFEVVRCLYYNFLAMPGWFLNGRILRRRVFSSFQIHLFDRLTFLVRWGLKLDLPFGLSLFAVAHRPE